MKVEKSERVKKAFKFSILFNFHTRREKKKGSDPTYMVINR